MLGPWMSKNLLAPLLQSVAGAALLAGGVYVGRSTTQVIGGCPADVRPRMVWGERALERGDIEAAARIAQEGLVESPNSQCAQILAAAVSSHRMRLQLAAGASTEAEAARTTCFAHASRAATWLGVSERAEALREECRAPTGAVEGI